MAQYGATADTGQRKVLRAIATCRTATLGGHRRQCEGCGHEEISYTSCRDRHCPTCQGLDEARWVEAQQRALLPVQYFHIVFTLPEEVALRRLGTTIGFTAVLHTWTQGLLYHPHIHCIVPGGGLDPEETRWVPARRDFFLPCACSRRSSMASSSPCSKRPSPGRRFALARARTPVACSSGPPARSGSSTVSPPFAGAEQVLASLGRYAYRIAISNDRLVSMHEGQVTFRWKDRAHGNAPRLATLDAEAFLRRFLLHVLPSRFVRIRHYGFLANPVRKERLPRVRELLGQPPGATEAHPPKAPEHWEAMLLRLTGKDVTRCPRCGVGHLLVIEELPALSGPGDPSRRARSP